MRIVNAITRFGLMAITDPRRRSTSYDDASQTEAERAQRERAVADCALHLSLCEAALDLPGVRRDERAALERTVGCWDIEGHEHLECGCR